MKIPKKVIIADIVWNIDNFGSLYNKDGYFQLFGEVSFSETKIRIASEVGCVVDGRDATFPIQNNLMVTALFHELWHIYCYMADTEQLDTEQNAKLFSYIALGRADSTTDDLRQILDNSLRILTERGILISDIEKSVISYYIYTTEFEY